MDLVKTSLYVRFLVSTYFREINSELTRHKDGLLTMIRTQQKTPAIVYPALCIPFMWAIILTQGGVFGSRFE